MKIQILASDIESSEYDNTSDCAIARAIRRAVKAEGIIYIAVGLFDFTMESLTHKLPEDLNLKVREMYNYIKHDDSCNKVKPEDFEYELPLNYEN